MTTPAEQFRVFCRQRYAWPGGYPLFAVTDDGAALCWQCSRNNYRLIRESQNSGARDGWRVEAVAINYDDHDMLCDHCGEPVECAYGDDGR